METLSPDGAEEPEAALGGSSPASGQAGGGGLPGPGVDGRASVAAASWTSGFSRWPPDGGWCHRRLRECGRGDASPPALGGESGVPPALPRPSPQSCLPGERAPWRGRAPGLSLLALSWPSLSAQCFSESDSASLMRGGGFLELPPQLAVRFCGGLCRVEVKMDFCSQPPAGVSALLTSLQSGQDNKIHPDQLL